MAEATSDRATAIADELRRKQQDAAIEKLRAQEKLNATKQVTDVVASTFAGLQQQQQLASTPQQKAAKQSADSMRSSGLNRERPKQHVAPEQRSGALGTLEKAQEIPERTPKFRVVVPKVMSAEEATAQETGVQPQSTEQPILEEPPSFQEPLEVEGDAAIVDEDLAPQQEQVEDPVGTREDEIESIDQTVNEIRETFEKQKDGTLSGTIEKLGAQKEFSGDEALIAAITTFAPTVLAGLFSGGNLRAMIGGAKAGRAGAAEFFKTRDNQAKTEAANLKSKAELLLKEQKEKNDAQQKLIDQGLAERKVQVIESMLGIKDRQTAIKASEAMIMAGWREDQIKHMENQLDFKYQQAWLKEVGGTIGKGKALSEKFLSDFADASRVDGLLDQLTNAVERHPQKFGVVAGRIAANNPRDEVGRLIQSRIRDMRQFIGKMREGGVLRLEDERKYTEMLPAQTDPPAVFRLKMIALKNTWKKGLAMKMKAMRLAGRDITPLLGLGITEDIVETPTPLSNFSAGEPGKGAKPKSKKEKQQEIQAIKNIDDLLDSTRKEK